jgi:hypothetical protein
VKRCSGELVLFGTVRFLVSMTIEKVTVRILVMGDEVLSYWLEG